MSNYQVQGNGMAANMIRSIQAAGFDISNDRDMQMGIVAYNSARLVWHAHNGSSADGSHQVLAKRHIGRNEPCPCGSGLKYKKCCLTKQSAPSAAGKATDNEPISFHPELIPRLMSVEGMSDDLSRLADLMERDTTLRSVRFDARKVEAFLSRVLDGKGLSDRATSEETDALAFRYVEHSGERRILTSLANKFVKAAESSKTPEELRGLAAGIFFAMAQGTESDAENPLIPVIFRLTVGEILKSGEAIRKMVEFVGSKEEIIREFESANPAFQRRINEALDLLAPGERDALMKHAAKAQDDLWESIDSGKFPVGFPLVSVLPFIFRLRALKSDKGRPSAKEFSRVLETAANDIGDEDRRLYGQLLAQWLSEDVDRADRITKGIVATVATMVKTGDFERLAPSLIVLTCRYDKMVCVDDEERKLIDSGPGPDDPTFLKRYSGWLLSRGYPNLAARTKSLGEQAEESDVRKFSRRSGSSGPATEIEGHV